MIIAVSGKMGSGKDTAAEMLSYLLFCTDESTVTYQDFVNYKRNCIKFPRTHAFADNLKKCLSILLNVDVDKLNDRNFKNSSIEWLNGLTVRQMLQKFATGVRNEIGEDFWIQSLFRKFNPETDFWIITDLRYMNELSAIRKYESIIIRIIRNDVEVSNHQSENDLDFYTKWDYVIDNNGSKEELFEKIKQIVKEISK